MNAQVLAQAEQAMARGSKSFAAASRLFDRETRRGVVLLYAWCRHCDDVVDGQQDGRGQSAQGADQALQHVDALAAQTEHVLAGGAPASPPFAALAEVVRRHRIPRRFPLEHLSGFRMDADGRRYRSLDDTLDYCWRVAGVVGVMMAMIMGRRHDATLDRAADLGLAFQMTNIARDVLDDHAAGRVYLPADWLAAEGIAPHQVGDPLHRPAVARVAAQLVDAAEPYYLSARTGLASLPWRSAWAVAAARGLYREIGLQVKARGAAAWDERIYTPRRRKLHHVLAGGLTATISRTDPSDPAPAPWQRERLWTRPRG